MPRRLELNEENLFLLDILKGWKKVIADRLDVIEQDQFFIKREVSKLRDKLEDRK